MKPIFLCMPDPAKMPGKLRQKSARNFLRHISALAEEVTGHAPCVAHSAFGLSGRERQRRRTEIQQASLFVVLPMIGSWEGGADFELAEQSGVPIVVLCATRCYNNGHTPQILLNTKKLYAVVQYSGVKNAVGRLCAELEAFKAKHSLRKRGPRPDPKARVAKKVRLTLHKIGQARA